MKREQLEFYPNVKGKSRLGYSEIIYGDVHLVGQFVYYYNEKGKPEKFQKRLEISSILYGSSKYLKLPIYNFGMERIHEVVFESDDYMVTNFYQKGNFLFVFKKENMEAVVKLSMHSMTRKKDTKIFEKEIKPYIKNCPQFLKELELATKENPYKKIAGGTVIQNILFSKVTNTTCSE